MPLVERRQVADRNAGDAALQQVVDRDRAAPLLAHGDDDFVDAEALDDRLQLQRRRETSARGPRARRRSARPANPPGRSRRRSRRADRGSRSVSSTASASGAGADDQRAARRQAADQRREQDRANEDDRGQREQRGVRQHRARPAGLRQHSEQDVADGNADAQGQQRCGVNTTCSDLRSPPRNSPNIVPTAVVIKANASAGNSSRARRNAVRPQLDRHREQHRERRRTRRTAPCRQTMQPTVGRRERLITAVPSSAPLRA